MHCVIPWWEDCFFHQGQRQVTNWAAAAFANPLVMTTQTPVPGPILKPTPTHLTQPPTVCTYTQMYTNKRTLSLWLYSKACSHIKSIKFTSHTKRMFPCCVPEERQQCNKQTLIQVSLTQGGFHTIITLGCGFYCTNHKGKKGCWKNALKKSIFKTF